MNGARAWLVVSPVVAAGVLASHALAYWLTATPTDRSHAYLEHAPQVLLVLALSSIVLGGFGQRREAPAVYVFPFVAVTTFVLQEHVERVLHEGSMPVLVTSPAFAVGLLLQVPVAFVVWLLARWLLAAVGDSCARRLTVRPRFNVPLAVGPAAVFGSVEPPAALGRGPPSPLRSS